VVRVVRNSFFLLVVAAVAHTAAASMAMLLSLRQQALLAHPYAAPLVQSYQQTAGFRVSSGYGLFRSMTGRGPTLKDAHGLPVATIARPEVVLEAQFEPDGPWFELEFPYKPGHPSRAPAWVAPHQPRLDWQMWFAALAPYGHSPWLMHFADLLLEGSPAAFAMLDTRAWPATTTQQIGLIKPPTMLERLWASATGSASSSSSGTPATRFGNVTLLQPPHAIRASLWHYDFTRIPSEWSSRVPSLKGSNSAASKGGKAPPHVYHPALSSLVDALGVDVAGASKAAEPWWQRTRVSDFFPTVTRGEESMQQLLVNFDWDDSRNIARTGLEAADREADIDAATAAALGRLYSVQAAVKRKPTRTNGYVPVLQVPSDELDCSAHVRMAAEFAALHGYPHLKPTGAQAKRLGGPSALSLALGNLRSYISGFSNWLFLVSKGLQNAIMGKVSEKSNPSGTSALRQAGSFVRAVGNGIKSTAVTAASIPPALLQWARYPQRGVPVALSSLGQSLSYATVTHAAPLVTEGLCTAINIARAIGLTPSYAGAGGFRWVRDEATNSNAAIYLERSAHDSAWWLPLTILYALAFVRSVSSLTAAWRAWVSQGQKRSNRTDSGASAGSAAASGAQKRRGSEPDVAAAAVKRAPPAAAAAALAASSQREGTATNVRRRKNAAQ
jgi:hypothetical protein